MANDPNVANGFQPYQNRGASEYRANAKVYYVPASTTNPLFLGDPVIKVAASADPTYGYDGVKLATAGTGNLITGIVIGFLGTSPNGGFFGASGAPGPYYKATNSTIAQWVLVDDSPESLYTVQCTGTPAATVVGKNVNAVSGNGSPYTGWSGWQVSATTATTSTWQFQIVGFEQTVDNIIGNKFANLIVRLNQSTEGLAATGI